MSLTHSLWICSLTFDLQVTLYLRCPSSLPNTPYIIFEVLISNFLMVLYDPLKVTILKQTMYIVIKIMQEFFRWSDIGSMFGSLMVYVDNMDRVCFSGVQMWWGVNLALKGEKFKIFLIFSCTPTKLIDPTIIFLTGIIITQSGPIFHPIIHYLR